MYFAGRGGSLALGAPAAPAACAGRDGAQDGDFDPAAAQTLYWRRVPVLVKRPDRDDRVESLTFRVLSGHARRGRNVRVSVLLGDAKGASSSTRTAPTSTALAAVDRARGRRARARKRKGQAARQLSPTASRRRPLARGEEKKRAPKKTK